MKRSERGFTLVEIMIVVAIIALLAAIAIPNVLRGRTSANEAAAVGNLRALISSLEMHRSTNQVYPDVWRADMYTTPDPDFGPPSFDLACSGAACTVQGFDYTYAGVDGAAGACDNTPADQCVGYTMIARPDTVGRSGTRSFFADETGLVRHCPAVAGALGTVANAPTWATLDQPADGDNATAAIDNCT